MIGFGGLVSKHNTGLVRLTGSDVVEVGVRVVWGGSLVRGSWVNPVWNHGINSTGRGGPGIIQELCTDVCMCVSCLHVKHRN